MNTEYFRIYPDRRLPNPLKAVDLPEQYKKRLTAEAFAAVDTVILAHYDETVLQDFPDVLYSPIAMMTEPMKVVIEEIMPECQFHAVQFLPLYNPTKQGLFKPIYWVPYLKPIVIPSAVGNFFSADVFNKMKKTMNITNQPVLQLWTAAESIWVVSLLTAERLLLKRPLGLQLERLC